MSECSKRIPDWKLGDPTGIHKSTRPFTDYLQSWKQGFESPSLQLMARSYVKELGQDVIEIWVMILEKSPLKFLNR